MRLTELEWNDHLAQQAEQAAHEQRRPFTRLSCNWHEGMKHAHTENCVVDGGRYFTFAGGVLKPLFAGSLYEDWTLGNF